MGPRWVDLHLAHSAPAIDPSWRSFRSCAGARPWPCGGLDVPHHPGHRADAQGQTPSRQLGSCRDPMTGRRIGQRCRRVLAFRSVLLLDAPVTFREVMAHEEVPLADVFREVGRFLIGREDVVLFGAQAVNVYAETERMTQEVDVMSTRAEAVAEELRRLLSDR